MPDFFSGIFLIQLWRKDLFTMPEAVSGVAETLSHPKLKTLPDRQLSFGTLRSLVKTFRGLSGQERVNVQTFVRKAVEGPGYIGGSLGAFGKGEATAAYNILSEKVEESALREMDQKLAQGGDEFRLPLAVVRSILHRKSPYKGFENVQIG